MNKLIEIDDVLVEGVTEFADVYRFSKEGSEFSFEIDHYILPTFAKSLAGFVETGAAYYCSDFTINFGVHDNDVLLDDTIIPGDVLSVKYDTVKQLVPALCLLI